MNLVWFRSDLRITDNSPLWNAINDGETIGCCLLPFQQWQGYGLGTRKIEFVKASAEELRDNLKQLGIELVIKEVPSFAAQIEQLGALCTEYSIQNVYWNNEYPLDERNRDSLACQKLEQSGIACHRYDDALILPPSSVTTQQGQIYKVFTPFKRAWLNRVEGQTIDSLAINGFKPEKIQSPDNSIRSGESHALNLLEVFANQSIEQYDSKRDIPTEPATSHLSAHLSAGTISPLTCLKRASEANDSELSTGNPGILAWISQLIWREFYYHLIATQDNLSKSLPFKPATEQIKWNEPGQAFEQWKKGKTGVPIVDAGMRQLNQTGWMHNRLRMITAMYLTKNLLIDWRLGERYFLEKLVDGDFALNNGGWQWSASTGTDAAPYFRVFNPFSQAKRFDPDASFIKTFVPELKDLPPRLLHSETMLKEACPKNYPQLTTDTTETRARAINAFKAIH